MKKKKYLVKWVIDVEATTPKAAAKEAWRLRNGEDSIANVFEVEQLNQRGKGTKTVVDLHLNKVVPRNEYYKS